MPIAISKLHLDIFNHPERRRVLGELRKLPRGCVLGGGTALALQIGHRTSYDFDLFYSKPIDKKWLAKVRAVFGSRLMRVLVNTTDELTVIVKPDIKITLLYYPFSPLHKPLVARDYALNIFDLRDIASSKAYTIGRRGVWRDYVDLYFLLNGYFKIEEILGEATKRFEPAFDVKMFFKQLTYYKDIHDTAVEYVGDSVKVYDIKKFFKTVVVKP